jgi:carbon-monoxide dehydrogenase large subunit
VSGSGRSGTVGREAQSDPVATKTNALGVKGVGKLEGTGSLPTPVNAILNSLAPAGFARFEMPAMPARMWLALQQARTAGGTALNLP